MTKINELYKAIRKDPSLLSAISNAENKEAAPTRAMPGLSDSAVADALKEILGQDALDALPSIVNVARGAPGVSYLGAPCAGVSPAAHVIHDAGLAAVLDGIGDLGVLLLFVEVHVSTTAVIHLDEVEVPVAKVELAVFLLVACEAHADAPGMAVAAAAGVIAGIAVDAGFQT